MEDGSESKFDAKAFMADLAKTKEEQARVVAQRPSAEDLSRSLHQFTDLLYRMIDTMRQIACAEAGEDPAATYRWAPRAGTIGMADVASSEALVESFLAGGVPSDTLWLDTNPARSPTAWGMEFLARCMHTVVDDLDAIAALIALGQHARATVTLSRSVLEAAVTGCFIIDPDAGPVERLRRVTNLRFQEVKETANGWDEGSENRRESEELLQDLIRFATRCGFRVQRFRPAGHQPPVIQGEGGSDAARQLVEEVLPGVGKDMWRSMSAVAHSRQSTTLYRSEYGLPHRMEPWMRTESTAWHTIASILAARELCRRIEVYLGWSLTGWPELFEQLCALWMIGAGMQDGRLREALGIEAKQGAHGVAAVMFVARASSGCPRPRLDSGHE